MRQRITRNFIPFKKGDKVWLEGKNLHLGYPNRKLAPKWKGPFTITEVLGPVTYRLKLPIGWKIHPVFHAGLLTPYRQNDEHDVGKMLVAVCEICSSLKGSAIHNQPSIPCIMRGNLSISMYAMSS